jgi:hypothetical protein
MSRGATLAVTEMTPSPPHQDERQRRGVITAVDAEFARLAADQLGPTLEIGRCVLDADDVRNLRETQHDVVLHVRDRAAGHVVEYVRQIDLPRQSP